MYRNPDKLWCQIMQKKYLDCDDYAIILTSMCAYGGFTVWKFMKEPRFVITDHLTWKICNGRRGKFWRDSWDGLQSIENMFERQDWISKVELAFGVYVANYLIESHPVSGIYGWIPI
ncbi:hypothetical protein SUGI_0189830 [Cryptomeria japonica]|nr:hypothetical protein SUGI_0189830 [Cryptomeria japonica]